MKPLHGVLLSPEDNDAWQHVLHRFMWRPVPDLGGLSRLSDRRDFTLMRLAQADRSLAAIDGVAVSGPVQWYELYEGPL
jgi:hypothetical protein